MFGKDVPVFKGPSLADGFKSIGLDLFLTSFISLLILHFYYPNWQGEPRMGTIAILPGLISALVINYRTHRRLTRYAELDFRCELRQIDYHVLVKAAKSPKTDRETKRMLREFLDHNYQGWLTRNVN